MSQSISRAVSMGILFLFLNLEAFVFGLSRAYAQEYTVVPPGTSVRGSLWISEGIAGVYSSNMSAANRLRVGGEVHLGDDYQFILGWTLYDQFWSGESSASTGSISRRGSDLNFGYFLIPDQLWLMYSLQFQDVSANSVIGATTVLGHQPSIGYRLFSQNSIHVAVEVAYLFTPAYTASTYNYLNNTAGTVNFPVANIWSLNFRLGYDIGGR